MAASEGFRRITTLGTRTAITGALLLVVGFFIRLWESRFLTQQNYSSAGFFLGPGYLLLAIGGLFLIAGWIGDGFVTKRDPEVPSA
jgi:hypothetical protein